MKKEYPYILWKLGFDFRRYAEVIFKNKINGAGQRPLYFMIGHSYELILKSFLLTKGKQLKFLKKEYGHNLLKLFKLAMTYKEFKEIAGIEVIESIVDYLNTYYKDKDFEYIETDQMRVVHPTVLFMEFDILSNVCKKTCDVFINKKRS